MAALREMRCEACHDGAPLVTPEELELYLQEVPEWALQDHDGIARLARVYQFPDFATALAFTNEIGRIAEEEGHHPAILTEWGRATVLWWTHKIKGLHRNDFIMAAKTDAEYAGEGGGGAGNGSQR